MPAYFYPRSPCGERPPLASAYLQNSSFLSTLSLRRATCGQKKSAIRGIISIHALLAESDRISFSAAGGLEHFYPRSPCGERRQATANITQGKNISIHALLAESDHIAPAATQTAEISIHALLAESDVCTVKVGPDTYRFLSTLSLRRATRPAGPQEEINIFLSTLSLRRATQLQMRMQGYRVISIHALLAESDGLQLDIFQYPKEFLSTLSLRRATGKVKVVEPGLVFLSTLSLRRATFQTRLQAPHSLFLSTLSLRRATCPSPC